MQRNLVNDIISDAIDACSDWIDRSLNDILLELINMKEDLSLQIAKDAENAKRKETVQKFLTRSIQEISKNYNP